MSEKRLVVVGEMKAGELLTLEFDMEELIREVMGWPKQ